MPFIIDDKAVKDNETVSRMPHPVIPDAIALKPITEAIGFGLMAAGLFEITTANTAEVYDRLWVCSRIDGTPPISLADVVAHVGLRTNSFPKLPMGRWSKGMIESLMRRARWAREEEASRLITD